MFGVGQPELLIIIFIALLLFGPGSLPRLSKTLGETIRGLKDGVTDGKNDESLKDIAAEVTNSAREVKNSINEVKQAFLGGAEPNSDVVAEAANPAREFKKDITEVRHASSMHKNLMPQAKDI